VRAAAAAVAITLALTLSASASAPLMSPAARAYLTTALDLLQANSIDAATVDWPAVRARAFARAGDARTTADTYPAIDAAIGELHDRHTALFRPDLAAELKGNATLGGPPTGRIVPGGYAYINVPLMIGDMDAMNSYAGAGSRLVRDLDRSRPCGWIVDLRSDLGGAMPPMLTVLAPLLQGPTLLYFVDRGGRSAVTLSHGQVLDNGQSHIEATNDYQLRRARPPVALLIGPHTASAGEATLIAFLGQPDTRTFGQPTDGLASGDDVFWLSDGASLLITGANDADRTGRVYPNLTPIQPDQPAPPPTPGGPDPGLAAASAWLATTAACRH
jgi:C-terminal processing protease CtpA/Prc